MRQYSQATGGAPERAQGSASYPQTKRSITGSANVWRSSSCIAEIKTANFSKKMPADNSDRYRHGGPYDRGSADKYYKRPASPHYFIGRTLQSKRIEEEDMTLRQVADYNWGYNTGEAHDSVENKANTRYVDGSKD